MRKVVSPDTQIKPQEQACRLCMGMQLQIKGAIKADESNAALH